MGAGGNVGACVTRQLAARGDDVRVLLRRSSSTRGIDGLDVQRHYGGIFDTEAVAAAMADRDVVYEYLVGALGALFRRDFAFTATGARLLALTSPADHSKATAELGWRPEPTEQAIRRAAQFYLERSKT